jgi:2,3-bisphosphoglycerate-dependent phosphoglycerate mutase
MMPTRVLLLRHAESADPSVFHGAESDIGLSARGRRQAAAVAGVLADLRPDIVVSSAMRRALDTALPIANACGLTVRVEPNLHERRVGSLSGTPNHRSDGVWPDTLARWMAGDTSWTPAGAESFDDVHDRILPVWQRLVADHAERTTVIVAHGLVCKVLLLSVLPGYSPADWLRLGPIPNVGISELIHERPLAGASGLCKGTWRAERLAAVPEAVVAIHRDP